MNPAQQEAFNRVSGIEGWMSQAELMWLIGEASTHKTIVEVGSWKGRSTVALAGATPGCVYAVDSWALKNAWYPDPEAAYREFLANTAGLIPRGKLKVYRGDSVVIAGVLRSTLLDKVDMVFIDGDHEYEHVKADLRAYLPLLRPDGLLCGHDYNFELNADVVLAVDELVPQRLVISGTSIWAWIVPDKGVA